MTVYFCAWMHFERRSTSCINQLLKVSVASNPGSLFRILSRSFGESSHAFAVFKDLEGCTINWHFHVASINVIVHL